MYCVLGVWSTNQNYISILGPGSNTNTNLDVSRIIMIQMSHGCFVCSIFSQIGHKKVVNFSLYVCLLGII